MRDHGESAYQPAPELVRVANACSKHLMIVSAVVQDEAGRDGLKWLLHKQAQVIRDLDAGLGLDS